MTKKAMTLAQLKALAAQTEDQTDTTAGGYDFDLAPAGTTVGRLVEYIELGKHPQPDYAGKAKDPADMVFMKVELLAPKNRHEYQDADKNDRVRYDTISFRISKKLNDKAKYTKLFNQMRSGRDDVTHMAQMIGEPLRFKVFHNVSKNKASKETTYANLWDKDGVMDIGVPKFQPDPLVDEWKDMPVAEATLPFKLFLFNNPTPETWDSIFIDGTRKVKDGDVETEVSKNWIQELIMSAVDFEGSRLEAMLGGMDEAELPIGEETEEEEAEDEAEAEEAKPAAKAKPATAAKASAVAPKAAANPAAAKPVVKPAAVAAGKKAAKPDAKPANKGDDALRAMGLL